MFAEGGVAMAHEELLRRVVVLADLEAHGDAVVGQCHFLRGAQQACGDTVAGPSGCGGDRVHARQRHVGAKQQGDVAADRLSGPRLVDQGHRVALGHEVEKAAPAQAVGRETGLFNADQGRHVLRARRAYLASFRRAFPDIHVRNQLIDDIHRSHFLSVFCVRQSYRPACKNLVKNGSECVRKT